MSLKAALAVVEHNLPGFESHQQQLHWLRLTAQSHEAALLKLNALAASLCTLADRLSVGDDSRVTRLLAPKRLLYNTCCQEPLEKNVHRSWWETMVTHSAGQRRTKAKAGPTRMTGQSKG